MLSGAGVTLAPHWLLLLSSLPKGVENTSYGGPVGACRSFTLGTLITHLLTGIGHLLKGTNQRGSKRLISL